MATGCNYTNLFWPDMWEGQCSYFGGQPALSEALGWVIVAGFGAIFAVITSVMVWMDYRYNGTSNTSEQFATAGRSLKVGLIACDIVSKWTWAATLLQSANVAWQYGVSGPLWYAAGATIQVLLFSVLAIEVKRKAPTCHTVLEIVKSRWGNGTHIVFFVFCIATNIIVTSMLILGGASVVTALTGINIYAGAILIPVGVMFYTAHGGLKATFIAAWSHVAILYIALVTFVFVVYAAPGDYLGSIDIVYNHLGITAAAYPVEGNLDGSFLTMWSSGGLMFGVINIIGNFGTVFVDQAYWQSAIAAQPSATYKGYLLGGLCWFAIPFSMATALGLAARAMDLPLTAAEASAGLVPPAVATALLGKGGAFLLVLQLFMAVTASGAAEQIAVSSLIAYDIYRPYINKKATGKQMILVGRIGVLAYGVLSGVFAIILLKIGLSLGWVYLFMGVVIGSAVVPIAMSLTWNKCSALAANSGAIGGLACAVVAWIVAAQIESGELSIASLGKDVPMLCGNIVAICVSALICFVVSFFKPQNFDWKELLEIPMIEEDVNAHLPVDGPDSHAALSKALRWTYIVGGALTVVLVILWPALALPAKVFSEGYFTMWIIIAMIWGLMATIACIFVPVWEAREAIVVISKGVVSSATACGKPPTTKAEVEFPDSKDLAADVKA